MAKIRKINVSEIAGNNPPGGGDAVMPAGTIVVYEDTDNGVTEYLLRVHDGVTDGGVPFANAPSIVHNNDINITVDNDDSSTYTWNFDRTGNLTAPGDITTGLDGPGGRFIQDCANGNTSMRWINVSQGSSGTQLIRAYTGNPKLNTEVERAQIKLNWDQTEDKSGLTIRTFNQSNPNNEVDHDWLFKGDGVLQLPVGGDIVDSEGNSVLGLVDNNIWVQTFETASPATDVPQVAVSVEYDSAGNIIALFVHVNPDNGSTYYSVGKYTTTGTRIWTARFDDEFYTDGWGLAVDNAGGFIYIAGATDAAGGGGQTNATLTKISGTTGLVEWSKTYDFGYNSTSAVVDVNSEGDPVMVGFAENGDDRYVATTTIDQTDGSIIWSRGLDGQGDEQAYGMAVGPTGEVVAIGYMDEYYELASHSVTPLVGSDVNVLVINRSDLSGDTLTDTWEVSGVDAEGTIGVDAINFYEGLTGTVREGTGAVFEIGDNGLGAYTASGIQNNGTNYLPGHKILVLGTDLGGATPANDCVITVDSVTEGGLIFNWSVTGTAAGAVSAVYGPVTGTNYQTGSGVTFNFFSDGESTYSAQPVEITAVGSNYVLDDVVTISGALLGGTSPANDMTVTVNADLGSVVAFMSFSGTQQTTTYRVRTEDVGLDFSGAGTWTLSGTVVDTDDRMVVVKYNTEGVIQWQRAIQFDEGYACSGSDADIDSQGNIYVCGQYYTDIPGPINQLMSIVKFNSSGVKQWSRRIVGNCGAFTSSIVVGADDHLYLSATTFAGTENTVEDIHLVLAKYSFDGLVEWQRLLDYTAGYSFGSSFFGAEVGGSNLAVKQDYVAVGLGFGSEESFGPDFGSTNAAVAQIPATGDIFTVGSWDFTAASFSGTVNSTASDIVVTDAGKTDYDNIAGIDTGTVTLEEDSSDFLIGTVYTAPGRENSLVNGAHTVVLGDTGTVTLPAGGTITEGYVTSNPTIQLTPASPDVASQKLVIKGGGAYTYTDNGISINYNNNTAIVGNTLTFYINSNTYADQTLYWWIHPSGANISDPGLGTVAVNEFGYGEFSFLLDSDDNEFTVRVSPEDNNYDPASLGVETGLINADAPTFDSEHHLHLTTGNLAETSIFLGTDDHNVRTTVNGGIEINTFLYPSGGGSGKWTFSENGDLTFPDDTVQTTAYIPGDIRSEGNINIDINLSDSTLRRWQFGEDGNTVFPTNISIDYSGNNVQFPRIIADSGKSFGVQGQGSTGSAALAWTVDPDAAGQYAAVSVSRAGGDNLAKVVLQAQSDSGNAATVKLWKFDETGTLTLPKASKISEVIPGTGAAANVIVIQSASSILNTSFATLPPAPISNYAVPGTDIVVNVTWNTNGEDYHSPRFEVVNGGTGHTGGGQFSGGEVLTVPYVDMGISGGGDWTWYVSDLASDAVLAAGLNEWTFGGDGTLTFPDATVQTTAFVQGEQVFTLDTGAIDYAPTVVDFNLLFVTPAIGYSETDPTSVTLPNGVPGQRLVIFNGYNLATLTVNPGPVGRDISSGVVAEFIYSGFDGLWIPLYGTNSPT